MLPIHICYHKALPLTCSKYCITNYSGDDWQPAGELCGRIRQWPALSIVLQ